MVTYAQLREMDFAKLTAAAEASGALSGNLSTRGSEVSSAADIPGGMWAGADASAAGSLMSPLPSPLYDASDAFRYTRGVLETLVDSLTQAQGRLDDAHELAAGTGIVIGADGSVTTPETESKAEADRNIELARQIKQIIDEALRMADEADGLAAEDIKNQRPLQEILPDPEQMRLPLLIAGPWLDSGLPGASGIIPQLYQKFYDNADVVDVWGGGDAKLNGDGLHAEGNVGLGWKEGVKLGENGEYGSVTGMLGAEGQGGVHVGPDGGRIGVGGFAGGSVTYSSPSVDVGPGNTSLGVGLTPRVGVGAEADLGISYNDGSLDIKPKVGVAWGPGFSVSSDITIDVPATVDSIGDAASSVGDLLRGR